MCNLVAVKTHTQPGQTILVDRLGHILRMETGGAALASGVVVEMLPSESGQFTAQAVLDALWPASNYTPPATLLCVEQTHNFGGGTVWTLDELTAVADVAHENGLAVHMDGARLMNAVVATGHVRGGIFGRLRFGVDRFHEGAGRSDGRRSGRVARLHRTRPALQASFRRGDAPGGHRRRRLHLCPGSSCRAPAGRS